MTTGLPLFELLPPAIRSSPTSVAAAESVKGTTGRVRRMVLDLLRQHPEGLTDEQIIDALGRGANGVRPRRIELVRMGLVRDSGLTRRTRAGRSATVWVATGASE